MRWLPALVLMIATLLAEGRAWALPSRVAVPLDDTARGLAVERLAAAAASEIITARGQLRVELRERRRERIRAWLLPKIVDMPELDPLEPDAALLASADGSRASARLLASIAAKAATIEPAAGGAEVLALRGTAHAVVVETQRDRASRARPAAPVRVAIRQAGEAAWAALRERDRRIGELRSRIGDLRFRLADAVAGLADRAVEREAASYVDEPGDRLPAAPVLLPLLRLQPADGEPEPLDRASLDADAAVPLPVAADGAVRSPVDGMIVFAGPFKDHGPLLIMAHRGGYHSLLSGLGGLAVRSGASIRAGDVVGTIADGGIRPVLRLRHGGLAVDPAAWQDLRANEGRS